MQTEHLLAGIAGCLTRLRAPKELVAIAGPLPLLAMSHHADALASAAAQVAAVRDDPAARLALMARVFRGPTGRAPRHLPYRRAALSFMRWQARRRLLDGSTRRRPAARGGGRSTSLRR